MTQESFDFQPHRETTFGESRRAESICSTCQLPVMNRKGAPFIARESGILFFGADAIWVATRG